LIKNKIASAPVSKDDSFIIYLDIANIINYYVRTYYEELEKNKGNIIKIN
jgi:hypothetical protein